MTFKSHSDRLFPPQGHTRKPVSCAAAGHYVHVTDADFQRAMALPANAQR